MNVEHSKRMNEGFQWGSFLLGVLSLILAFLAFNNPVISIFSVTVVFAISAIMKGLYELFIRRKMRQYTGVKSTYLIIIGVIDLFIGVFFLFNLGGALLALPYLFALWILFDSIGTLLTANTIRQYSTTQFWFTIIVGGLGVVLGFLLLFNPISAYIAIATIVGLYFMLNGVLNIVYAF